jgi:hypothetical protein
MQMKALHSFEMSGTTHPVTEHHIPEELTPQDTGSLEATRIDRDLVKFFEKISEKWQHSIKVDSLTFILNMMLIPCE